MLAKNYPNFVRIIALGNSTEQRPLLAVEVKKLKVGYRYNVITLDIDITI